MVNPTIAFTADLAEPDLYNDVNGLPDPFTMNIIIGITNTHTATLYFKASITSPPAAYTSSSTNLGSVAAGLSGFFVFTPVRHPPTLTAGEYDETLTFRIDAYTDAGYSTAYANQTLSVVIHHFDHADASWAVVGHTTFDDGTDGGWVEGTGVIDASTSHYCLKYIQSTYFYSSPYSLRVSGGVNGRHNTKTFNTAAYSKARFVIHVREGNAYAKFALRINNVLVKPFALNLVAYYWCRLAFNMPIGSAIVCKFAGDFQTEGPCVDEIWVIAK